MKRYIIPVVFFVTVIFQILAGSKNDPVLMTINGKDVHQSEFEYLYNKNKLQQAQPQSFDEYLEMFIVYKLKVADAEAAGIDTTSTFRNELRGYFKDLALPYLSEHTQLTDNNIFDQLADKEPEFKNIMNEYRDGILLFEISNRNVWEKSVTDKTGLENYFLSNISLYKWNEPHYKGYVIYAPNDSLANVAGIFLNNTKPNPDSLTTVLRANFGRDIKAEKVITARGENPIVDHIAFSGESPEPKGRWNVWFGYMGRIINAPEEAADVRGPVTSDYQQLLEKKWVEKLRKKYPVKLNKKVIRQLRK